MNANVPTTKTLQFHAGLMERLVAEGRSPDAARALLDFDSAMFRWLRMSTKGEMPGALIAELGLDLDLTQFSCLTAIIRIQTHAGAPEPATIGRVAEEMMIDPSRASRIATDLIQRGFLRREAVQEDGRKSGLALTDEAISALNRFRDRKWDNVIDLFRDWSEDDITRFSTLFARYSDGVRARYKASE